MRELLLTDAALWSALIIVAALIISRRWRSRRSRIPARSRRREAAERARQKTSPPKAAIVTRHDEDRKEPGHSTPPPAGPPQAAAAQAGSRRPGPQRAGRQAPRAATPGEQIVSYYDQADQPIADYLAALGWAQQPPHTPGRVAGAAADSAAEPRGGTPAR